jgi:hypothetical protein
LLTRESQVDLAAGYCFDVTASTISASTPVGALSLSAQLRGLSYPEEMRRSESKQVLVGKG